MRGLQKSKRVSWASDVNLCQVRLFLSEESPLQVGLGAQDHLQAKASWLSHPAGSGVDDFLPPGFEGGNPDTNHVHINLSEIPVIKWRCPPRFVLDLTWQVVAAEESKEVEIQNQREMRVLEAVYPRLSAIPSNPVFSSDIEDSHQNDHQVPMIPITPIEDEDATDVPPDLRGTANVPMSSQSQLLGPRILPEVMNHNISNSPVSDRPAANGSLGVEPHVAAAASAAFAAINRSNEHGSLIDHDLLIKILNNPKLIEKLIQDYGAGAGNTSNTPNIPKPTASLVLLPNPPPPPPVSVPDPSYLHMNRTDTSVPSSFPATSNGSFYPQPNGAGLGYRPNGLVPPPAVPASSASSSGVAQMKGMNYYKNLIQQHGGERQDAPHQYNSQYGHHQVGASQEVVNPKPREPRPKSMKPCMYFSTPRGCRHGANCAYQHDTTSQQRSTSISEVQSAKRMKMDREISS